MFNKTGKVVVKVEGMACKHCATKVEEGLKKIDNVDKVKVDLNKKEVTIFSKKEVDLEKVKNVIEELNYSYEGTIE